MKFPPSSTSALLTLFMITKYVDAGVAITGPLGNIWSAGSNHIITWTDNGDGSPMPANFNIDLMSGPLTGLQLVGSIATNTDSATGQYSWSIPPTVAPGKEYALRFGIPPNIVYSPYFEITATGSESGSGSISAPSGSTGSPPTTAGTSMPSSPNSIGDSRPTGIGSPSVIGNKPASTSPPIANKQSGSNEQMISPSVVLILVISLLNLVIC
ncbi:hypothetical protein K7432_002228 [Basidiobolus ranarum]|uniref:Yeast cell wall synthesis Kre9/Knh1-like N-terminal domain-containing protein n=1 Tax=Basidiobolus ranarum TaxID=34480 RepID=A0ABR2W8L1_9FUNG